VNQNSGYANAYGNGTSTYVVNNIILKAMSPIKVKKSPDIKTLKTKINLRHVVNFEKDDLGVSYYDNEFNAFRSKNRFKALDLIVLSIINSYIVNKFNKDYNNQTIVINNKELQVFLGNNRIKKEKLVAMCDRLVNNKISFGDIDDISLFTKARYENGNFYLTFNKELALSIINRKKYTKVDNHHLFKLYRESNNAEAIRLYQYMSTFNGIIYSNKDNGKNNDYRFKKDFTYKELCDILGISGEDVATVKTYNRDRNRDRIIQNAISRINNSTNMQLELTYELLELENEQKVLTNSIYMDIHFTQYDKLRPIALDYFEHEINTSHKLGYSNYARNYAHGTQLKDLFDYLSKHKEHLIYNEKEGLFKFANGKTKDRITRKFIHVFTNRFIDNFNPISTKTFHYKSDSQREKFDYDYKGKKFKIASSKNEISYLLTNLSDQYKTERFSGIKFGSKKGNLSV